jgi:hypothetical protein
MRKTTVYLPDDLSDRLARISRELGRSEASLIREGVELAIQRAVPEPAIPLFRSGQPDLARRFDEYLSGFGDR